MKRKIRDLIFGYDDILVQIIDWLLILVEAATKAHLPLQSTIIQLQANDSLNEQQLPSSVFTGKVRRKLLLCCWTCANPQPPPCFSFSPG